MSEQGHTPGPWGQRRLKRSIEIFWLSTGKKIASISLNEFISNDKTEANARLIAAAPELLDALMALIPEGWTADDTMDHMPGIKQARAAIAKATA